MKRVYVADLKPGDSVKEIFRAVDTRLAPYRDESQGEYLQLILADRTGRVEARLWQNAATVASWLSPGDLVRVAGRATLYKDRIRLRIDSLDPVDVPRAAMADLLGAPVVDIGEALQIIHAAISRVRVTSLRDLLASVFEDGDLLAVLSLAPPERPGELLARTAELVELAAPLMHFSPELDGDLLQAAILLHGLGAVQAVAGGAGAKAVAWLGVPALSDQLLTERLSHRPDFPADLAVELRHCILAAASPATARSREARVLIVLRQLQTAVH